MRRERRTFLTMERGVSKNSADGLVDLSWREKTGIDLDVPDCQ